MATSTTITEVPSGINNFYNRTLLKKAVPRLLHLNWAQVKDIPANNSEVIKFRRYTVLSVATTPLTEGTAPSSTVLAVTNVTATVAQYGAFVQLTDFLQFTTLDPLLTETAELLGQQAGNSLDQICRDVIVAGTTVQRATGVSARTDITSAMLITLDEVQKAVRTLNTNNADKITSMINPSTGFNTTPILASYVGICSEKTYYDLKRITGWVPISEYPSQSNLLPGEVGSLDEVRFCMTTNGKVFSAGGSGGIDVHGTMILAAEAYAITRVSGHALENIVKPLGSAGTSDPLSQISTSGWKASFVAKILNENFLLRIEHAVSA